MSPARFTVYGAWRCWAKRLTNERYPMSRATSVRMLAVRSTRRRPSRPRFTEDRRGERLRPHLHATAAKLRSEQAGLAPVSNTASNIAGVSRPVFVFSREQW